MLKCPRTNLFVQLGPYAHSETIKWSISNPHILLSFKAHLYILQYWKLHAHLIMCHVVHILLSHGSWRLTSLRWILLSTYLFWRIFLFFKQYRINYNAFHLWKDHMGYVSNQLRLCVAFIVFMTHHASWIFFKYVLSWFLWKWRLNKSFRVKRKELLVK